MPTFSQSLNREDYDRILILFSLWGEKESFPDAQTGIQILSEKIDQEGYFRHYYENLETEAKTALQDLVSQKGRITWTTFKLRYGDFREMGVSKRDREKPFETPISTTEYLYYRGLIARGHFPTSRGILEHAYLPDDLNGLVPQRTKSHQVLGRPATSNDILNPQKADNLFLETMCTYLSSKRNGLRLEEMSYLDEDWILYPNQLERLLQEFRLIDDEKQPISFAVKTHLTTPAKNLFPQLFKQWQESTTYQELGELASLTIETMPEHDAKNTRRFIINAVASVPRDTWWQLDSFVGDIQQSTPDFLRIHGNFNSWMIRDQQTQKLLTGLESWDKIEGTLIRFVIVKLLFGFGFVELAMNDLNVPTAFQLSDNAENLLRNLPVSETFDEENKLVMNSEGTIETYPTTERVLRYQIARFADWMSKRNQNYSYQINASSLQKADEQNLRPAQLLRLIASSTSAPIPPTILKAIQQWESHGTEIKIQPMTVLKVNSEELLKKIQDSPAQKYLGIPLGKTSVIINEGAEEKLMKVIISLGYFSDYERREMKE